MGTAQLDTGPEWAEAWTRGQGEAHVRALMRATWNVEADGVWSAPGRVTIIGEHTDYNGGVCLPTVIPHRTYVAARRRDDDVVRIVSEGAATLEGPGERWETRLDDISHHTAAGWPGYIAGVLWALRERGFDGPGLDLAFASCVPVAAGLASSGALECATALATNALWKLALDDDAGHIELASACIDAENEIVRVATGGIDQHTQLRCREGEAVELDFATQPPAASHCPLYFPDYGLALLIIDTRVPHARRGGGYHDRRRDCEEAAQLLGVENLGELAHDAHWRQRLATLPNERLRRRTRHVVTEIERVRTVAAELSDTGPAHERFVNVGKELFRSHASLEVDYEISGPELNLAVDAAFGAGALGARLLGGGFCGSAMALVRRASADQIAQRIATAFAERDLTTPRFLLV